MSKHSFDSWSVDGPTTLHGCNDDPQYLVIRSHINDPDREREVALVGAWDVEGEQNARLIVAAPKLRAACQAVVDRWESGDLAEAVGMCSKAIAEVAQPAGQRDGDAGPVRTIRLPCYGVTIRLDREGNDERPHCGAITSDLKSAAPNAGEARFNAAIDGLESLILAHACAGVDVESPAYVEGIETAIEAITNNL